MFGSIIGQLLLEILFVYFKITRGVNLKYSTKIGCMFEVMDYPALMITQFMLVSKYHMCNYYVSKGIESKKYRVKEKIEHIFLTKFIKDYCAYVWNREFLYSL